MSPMPLLEGANIDDTVALRCGVVQRVPDRRAAGRRQGDPSPTGASPDTAPAPPHATHAKR